MPNGLRNPQSARLARFPTRQKADLGDLGQQPDHKLNNPGVQATRQRVVPRAHVAQLLEVHPWHLHVDVNPVHQRTGDTLLVARHGDGRAGARTGRAVIIDARTGVWFTIKAGY